ALKDALGKIMQGLGQNGVPAPDGLGEADRQMEESASSLDQNALDLAESAQRDALESLRRSARDLANSQMATNGIGSRLENDPLGRSTGTGGISGFVKLPDQSQLQRAREILEELRRRSAERNRPPEELNYIDRLLQRF